jgi:uncharacterized protein YndB with AHSA1/START domain
LKFEREQIVAAGPDAVYAIVGDLQRRPTWLGELVHVDPSATTAEAGMRFEGESRLLLHRFPGSSEVVRAEPGVTLSERVHLGARLTSEWTFAPTADGGTRVRHCMEVTLPGGPLGPIERFVLRRRIASLQRAALESLVSLASA